MRVYKSLSLVSISLLLGGCVFGSSAESKIADLSGIVFLIFIAVLASKYVAPKLFMLSIFATMRKFIARVGHKIFLISIPIAISLSVYGFMNNILDRVIALVGLTLIILTFHLKDLDSEDSVARARAFDIVSMGSVITGVLLALWFMGADLIKL